LRVTGSPPLPYLRFRLGGGCRLFIATGVLDGSPTARLLGPLDHARAAAMDEAAQDAYLDELLAEPWWRQGLGTVEVLARVVPARWGREFALYRDAMNPVMTARLARGGRLTHRSPWVRGLYLAGSATHPGQWVSFCAISGILAARRVEKDLK